MLPLRSLAANATLQALQRCTRYSLHTPQNLSRRWCFHTSVVLDMETYRNEQLRLPPHTTLVSGSRTNTNLQTPRDRCAPHPCALSLLTYTFMHAARLCTHKFMHAPRLCTYTRMHAARLCTYTQSCTPHGCVRTQSCTPHGCVRTQSCTPHGCVRTQSCTPHGCVRTQSCTKHGCVRTHSCTPKTHRSRGSPTRYKTGDEAGWCAVECMVHSAPPLNPVCFSNTCCTSGAGRSAAGDGPSPPP
jgi:hypothetical protein